MKTVKLKVAMFDDDAVNDLVQGAVERVMELNEPHAFFPFQYRRYDEDGYGGAPPDEPGSIYFEAPLGYSGNAVFSLTVAELVDDIIESHEEWGPGGVLSEEVKPDVKCIIASLRSAADKLEAAVNRTVPNKPPKPRVAQAIAGEPESADLGYDFRTPHESSSLPSEGNGDWSWMVEAMNKVSPRRRPSDSPRPMRINVLGPGNWTAEFDEESRTITIKPNPGPADPPPPPPPPPPSLGLAYQRR